MRDERDFNIRTRLRTEGCCAGKPWHPSSDYRTSKKRSWVANTNMGTLKFVVCLFACLFCTLDAAAQKCEVHSGFRGSYFRVGYDQREVVKLIRSLDEVPKEIKKRLNEHLRQRLGSKLAEKLKFEEGEWLDRDSLRRLDPSVYEDNAELGSYDLLFSFSDPGKGLKAFFTKIVLNEDGSVNREINLPDVVSDPSKAEIIPCSAAYSIAESSGFPRDLCGIRFEYSGERQAFVWILTDPRETEPDDPWYRSLGVGRTYRQIDIDANTGAIVRIYKITIAL